MSDMADLILFNGKITTLDRPNPEAQAVAIRDGRFTAVGTEREVMTHAGPDTKRLDLRGRRAIPGLIDSHMHVIRGGLNYNMELRWDGVRSLADALRMLKVQVDRTPAPRSARPRAPRRGRRCLSRTPARVQTLQIGGERRKAS